MGLCPFLCFTSAVVVAASFCLYIQPLERLLDKLRIEHHLVDLLFELKTRHHPRENKILHESATNQYVLT